MRGLLRTVRKAGDLVRSLGRFVRRVLKPEKRNDAGEQSKESIAALCTDRDDSCEECGTQGAYAGACVVCEGWGSFVNSIKDGNNRIYKCTRCNETGICVSCLDQGRKATKAECVMCAHVFTLAEKKYALQKGAYREDEANVVRPLCEACAKAQRAATLNKTPCKCGETHHYNHHEGKIKNKNRWVCSKCKRVCEITEERCPFCFFIEYLNS